MKIKSTAALVAALLVLLPASIPVMAAGEAEGAYTASTNTYYLNPDTGKTDDGGSGDAAIGEGMCRSVVDKTALIELDGGKIYLTVRLLLMSNMKDIRAYTQTKPGGSYKSASLKVMQEDAVGDSADYRFEHPSATSYVSWEMHVIPMGRDVKFYMNLSDSLKPGGGDFVVSVKPKAGVAAAAPVLENATAPAQAPVEVTEAVAGAASEPVAETRGEAAPSPSPAPAPAAPGAAEASATPEPADTPATEETASPRLEETASPGPSPSLASTPTAQPSPGAKPGVGVGEKAAPILAGPSAESQSAFPLWLMILGGIAAIAIVVVIVVVISVRRQR